MTAPEPWREADGGVDAGPYVPGYRYKDNKHETEMSWGPGMVAHYNNGRPPSEHGQYMPKCPEERLPWWGLTPYQKPRPPGEVRGYPGEQIAR
jgi:hypothetical protein